MLILTGGKKGNLHDTVGAITDFSKAIEINPRFHEAYFSRGVKKGELGDYQAAKTDYTKAIEIYPNYHEAYYNRG